MIRFILAGAEVVISNLLDCDFRLSSHDILILALLYDYPFKAVQHSVSPFGRGSSDASENSQHGFLSSR